MKEYTQSKIHLPYFLAISFRCTWYVPPIAFFNCQSTETDAMKGPGIFRRRYHDRNSHTKKAMTASTAMGFTNKTPDVLEPEIDSRRPSPKPTCLGPIPVICPRISCPPRVNKIVSSCRQSRADPTVSLAHPRIVLAVAAPLGSLLRL